VISYKGGLENGMITDRETASPVGRVEQRGISPGVLLRQTGLLAMAAGVSTFLSPILHPDDPGSAAWVPAHLLFFATLIAVLLVLVGVFVRQLPRSGRLLGLAGFLAAFVGTSMMLMEGREHLFSHDFGQGTPVGLWQLIATSLVFSVGYILLGVAIFRAGVLPRGAGVLLAVGGPIVAFSPPLGILTVLFVGHTLFGAGLAWLGYALFFSSRDAARRNVGRQTAADATIR
jgi:hypothetical protein